MTTSIEIFDVGHGACSVITSPASKRLMIDCGDNPDRPWFPSSKYSGISIEELVISNFDEDHVSDLPNLLTKAQISFMVVNNSVSPDALEHLKMETGMGTGIQRLITWMRHISGQSSSGNPNFDEISISFFYNEYPRDFEDENNLSVVTFVEYSGFRIIYPGDLESAGWQSLLRNSLFSSKLQHINVFVASHHGRKSGCCEDVFYICKPQIVVMSDRDRQFNSQETTQWYSQRCEGINYQNGKRYVFTTRSDGDIKIVVDKSSWSISTSR